MGVLNRSQGNVADLRPRSNDVGVRGTWGLMLPFALFAILGQEPLAAQELGKAAVQSGDTQALSAHYHFVERYTDDPTKAGLLNQYQVGYRETAKVTRENPQGAPTVAQGVVQAIYTERVAKLTKEGMVAELVRRYDRANLTSTMEVRRLKSKRLEGLTILYRLQSGVLPQIVSVSGRALREEEFKTIIQQTFLPGLTTILPRQPVRVGDTWSIPRMAAWALLGSQPVEDGYEMKGEVLSVRKNQTGASMTAVLGMKGQCVVEQGPSGINAILEFTFEPSVAQAGSGESGRTLLFGEPVAVKAAPDQTTQGNFDAPGSISRIRLAQEVTTSLGDEEARLKQRVRREILLERRLPSQAQVAGGQALEVPNPLPAATVENSWLIYDDPDGRFHLLHPQEMKIAKQYEDGGIDLLDRRLDGQDVITINLLPKTGDPQRDRLATDPIQEEKRLNEDWKRRGEKVLPGAHGWLPDADWAKLKRRVYRIEAALLAQDDPSSPPSGRIYLDQYIVQFNRNETMKLRAMTTRDPHVPFRDKAESVIKSFELGPSESSLPARPAPTTGTRSAPR